MLQATPKNIHIYLESNPNPNSLKFVVNEMLVPEGLSYDFPDAASAANAPLAQELFEYPFVDRVFYASNFVTVTKKGDVEWLEIQNTIKNHILKFLEMGKFIIDVQEENSVSTEEETETVLGTRLQRTCLLVRKEEARQGDSARRKRREAQVHLGSRGPCRRCRRPRQSQARRRVAG